MRHFQSTLVVAATSLAAAANAATFSSIPMHHATRGEGPFFYGVHASQKLQQPGNGSDVPTGGAVWPTAIYWTMVEIGTPPLLFPVAIDSGSGDLDVGGANCDGCVHGNPNRPYDHEQSSTSSPAFPYEFSNSYQTCDLQDPTVSPHLLFFFELSPPLSLIDGATPNASRLCARSVASFIKTRCLWPVSVQWR